MGSKPAILTQLAPGYRLERYELLCPIASGGMANVWAARLRGKHGFEKLVAIKTILPNLATDPRFRSMFLDEARISSGIEHPNVAQVLDMGEEGEILYLVMEFVDGDALSKVLRMVEQKKLAQPYGVVLRILADACGGLHAAHELRDKSGTVLRGVVHRDISPQNVMVSVTGAAKLIDFGIAKARDRLAQETVAGGLKGKINWMAPEQALGRAVDRRSDLWSVGAILYYVCNGAPPFDGGNELATLHALASGAEAAPIKAEIHPALRALVMRAITMKPDGRFATALELQSAIEASMDAAGLRTTQADVAGFLQAHLADRSAARRDAINYSMSAAFERERVADALGAVGTDMERTSADGLLKMHARVMAQAEADELSAPELAIPELAVEPVRSRTKSWGPDLRPPASAPARAAAPPLPPPVAGFMEPFGVPDLVVPPEPARLPKPARPPPKPPPAPRPLSAPPRAIASAAGSIMGVDEREAPSFLDPRALAAAARSRPDPGHAGAPQAGRGAPPPGVLALPARPFTPAFVATRTAPAGGARSLPAIAAAALVALMVAIVWFAAPGYARTRCIAAARAQGVTMTIDTVAVSFGSVRLAGVTLVSPEIPIKVSAAEVSLELRGLDPTALSANALEISASGDLDDVAAAVSKWRAGAGAEWGAGGRIKRVTLRNAHIVWSRVLGNDEVLGAETVDLELVRGATGIDDEVHLTSPRASLTTARGTFGPWRVDAERSPRAGRLRIGFDPLLPDGPSALFVRGDGGTASTVAIPRTPLARLGIPAAALGLTADDATQVEATIQVTRPLPARVSGEVSITAYDAKLAGAQNKQNIILFAQLAGDPTKPLELMAGTLSFGPLKATAEGALTLYERGFGVDLRWTVAPVPCGVLLNKVSQKQASASGLLGFDTRHPDRATFTLTSQSTCGVVIFPSQ